MAHIEFIGFPLAYLSALFVGWSLRSFKNEKDQVDLEIQVAALTVALENTKSRLQAELAEAKAEVESLKLKLARVQYAIDSSDTSDDDMPGLVE
jgi:hypothetical protein